MIEALRNGAMASKLMQSRAPALPPLLVTLLTTGLVCACATTTEHKAEQIPALSGQETPSLPSDDLIEVSDEMREFLASYVPHTMNLGKRAWTLAYLANDRYVMPFRYDPTLTLPPAETFRRKTGNCLSFSMMLVAMARHVGVAARFEEAILEPEYRSVNDTFINSRHITVSLGQGQQTFLVDVSGAVFEENVRTRPISDRRAAAQYYNNLGVEALLAEDLPVAWSRFRQALWTDAGTAYLWSNLGVVYKRNGQGEDAERAYRKALAVDRGESIALNNLYVIYQEQGRYEEAAVLERRVERHRMRNPYYLALLASEALESRHYDDAIDLLERSIKINSEEYRFHGALAQAQYLAGDYEKARNSLDTARSLAPPEAMSEFESLPLNSLPH